MYSQRHPPPYRATFTIALFGKRVQLKNSIAKTILGSSSAFGTMSNDFVVEMNSSFKIISTPDFYDEDYPYPDQMIIDFMAYSHPGPDLFMLAIDPENTEEEMVVAQICKLQDIFGEKITSHLVVALPDIESFHALSHLKRRFNTRLTTANENLATECKKWCLAHPFQYDYRNYSEAVVRRRMAALEMRRHDGHPSHRHWRAGDNHRSPPTSLHALAAAPARPPSPEHHIGNGAEVWDNILNIVLLGLTGTGKSASGNTILAAGNSERRFKSEPSSTPVTTQCEVVTVEKPFRKEVRVVDTPDFFSEEFRNSQAQVEECKKYCQPERCVVLLVLQLGRFTDDEREILKKLEDKLDWEIRERTMVLLTHKEDLKGNPDQFINKEPHLKAIVELCSRRYHLFNNNSKSNKQVMELIQKFSVHFPSCFPKVDAVSPKSTNACCVC